MPAELTSAALRRHYQQAATDKAAGEKFYQLLADYQADKPAAEKLLAVGDTKRNEGLEVSELDGRRVSRVRVTPIVPDIDAS